MASCASFTADSHAAEALPASSMDNSSTPVRKGSSASVALRTPVSARSTRSTACASKSEALAPSRWASTITMALLSLSSALFNFASRSRNTSAVAPCAVLSLRVISCRVTLILFRAAVDCCPAFIAASVASTSSSSSLLPSRRATESVVARTSASTLRTFSITSCRAPRALARSSAFFTCFRSRCCSSWAAPTLVCSMAISDGGPVPAPGSFRISDDVSTIAFLAAMTLVWTVRSSSITCCMPSFKSMEPCVSWPSSPPFQVSTSEDASTFSFWSSSSAIATASPDRLRSCFFLRPKDFTLNICSFCDASSCRVSSCLTASLRDVAASPETLLISVRVFLISASLLLTADCTFAEILSTSATSASTS
mmetsp:Transcript_103548/g.205817  ORF Transcript_103548/g.205817 Transcript_103548/m.205817 type:complete len:367 (+) Transcript_103548:2229-3329(+)